MKWLHLFESYWKEVHKKRFNSMSHFFEQKVRFPESLFFFWHKVQFFETYWKVQLFDSFWKKLSHIREKKVQFLGRIRGKVQFFDSYSKKKINFAKKSHIQKIKNLWVVFRKRFNSVTRIHISKKNQFCESCSQKGSILRVIYQMGSMHSDILKRGFNSLSHMKKTWIIWVIFFRTKKVQFFESYFSENG